MWNGPMLWDTHDNELTSRASLATCMSSLSRPFVVGCNKCQENDWSLEYKRLQQPMFIIILIKSFSPNCAISWNYCICHSKL